MSLSAFPYIGGKTRLSSWIIDYLPEHTAYIEVFGGSGAVLLNKPRSEIEVFNDRDEDITHFFEVLRDDQEALESYVREIPYSRSLYQDWAHQYFRGYRPVDDVERAARWLFIRYASFGGKAGGISGFSRDSASGSGRNSLTWKNVPDRLEEIRDRFQAVTIENMDFAELIDRYDDPDAVFYCDPPYLEADPDYYPGPSFDHERFVEAIRDIDGQAVVSYTAPPEALAELDWWVVDRKYRKSAAAGASDWDDQSTERLFMNFEPGSEKA